MKLPVVIVIVLKQNQVYGACDKNYVQSPGRFPFRIR